MLMLVSACATLSPDFEQPSVRVSSFRPLPSEGLSPRFEIGLRVINPNADALKLRGMSYRIFLDEYELVEGAANDLPSVPGYGEADFKVLAVVSLMEGLRFVNSMMQKPATEVRYKVQAKLDIGALLPAIRIEETGLLAPPR